MAPPRKYASTRERWAAKSRRDAEKKRQAHAVARLAYCDLCQCPFCPKHCDSALCGPCRTKHRLCNVCGDNWIPRNGGWMCGECRESLGATLRILNSYPPVRPADTVCRFAEIEFRVERYAERVARGLPLFGDGDGVAGDIRETPSRAG